MRTVFTRLGQKGDLTHTAEARTYIHSPHESGAVSAARAVKGMLDRYCKGSLGEVLLCLVDARLLDEQELQRLARVRNPYLGKTVWSAVLTAVLVMPVMIRLRGLAVHTPIPALQPLAASPALP